MAMQFDIEVLGFTKAEIEEIEEHFSFTLSMEDWESIEILEEEYEDDDNILNLPSRRVIHFPEKLIKKERYAQMN